MSYYPSPPPRPATEAQVAAAVAEIKSYMAAVAISAVVVLWFGIVLLGPIAQRVLEAVAPDIYCGTVECVVVHDR